MEPSEAGLVAATEGWFVVNVRDAAWVTGDHFGDACIFEGEAVPFGQIGYTLAVLRPGQPSGLYHHEPNQEDFLVLAGECLLLLDGEERPLRAWDFVHCEPGAAHAFVGAGDGPCWLLQIGARREGQTLSYPPSALAARYGAEGVQESDPYADWPDEARPVAPPLPPG